MALQYPIYLNLESETCLVVGGGPVGERKVESLLEAGSKVRVVSLDFTDNLKKLAEAGRIHILVEAYGHKHLDAVKLVFAATNDRKVNAQISADCAEAKVLCNRADNGAEGDFVTSSVIRRGDLIISFTTGSLFPALTGKILKELESRFDVSYADYVSLLGSLRSKIKSDTSDPKLRKTAAESLLNSETDLLKMLRDGEKKLAIETAYKIVEDVLSHGRNT